MGLAVPQTLTLGEQWILFALAAATRLVDRFLLSITVADDSPVLCCLKDVFLLFVFDVDIAHCEGLTSAELLGNTVARTNSEYKAKAV
jgi:hypothetical protein